MLSGGKSAAASKIPSIFFFFFFASSAAAKSTLLNSKLLEENPYHLVQTLPEFVARFETAVIVCFFKNKWFFVYYALNNFLFCLLKIGGLLA